MTKRIFPHPLISSFLFITWMLLVNEFKIGSLVMAFILATIIPIITSVYWPDCAKIKSPIAFISYILMVLWDIVIANIQVAKIIIFMAPDHIKSAWIIVPLEIESPESITLLAGTITMTPGTLSAEISQDGKMLLVHALHAPNPDSIRDDIKARYETRLKRIFA